MLVRIHLALLFMALCCLPAHAQMASGTSMKDFGSVFALTPADRAPAAEVHFVSSGAPANILWPKEQTDFKFSLKNNGTAALHTNATVELIAWGTRGIPGDIWLPQVFKINRLSTLPVLVDIAAGQSAEFTVHPDVPERLGAYALVLDAGPAGRYFITSFVRTFQPLPERLQFPTMSLDDIGVEPLGRLGIQAIRYGIEFVPPNSPDYPAFREKLRQYLARLNDHHITALLMIGGGPTAMPLGRGRPHLTDDGVMLGGKEDLCWTPELDGQFKQFVHDICMEQGWPKGPVTAFSLWNEPWEGESISGWQADMPRYRTLFHTIAEAVHEANGEGKTDVLVAGADSSSNTMDKFFSGDDDSMLADLDAVTIHYQGIASPSTVKKWLARKPRRVQVWDTESWVANVDDRVAAVIATDRAAGYDRAMGVYGGNVYEDGNAWPVAAAVGAAQHFLGQRDFRSFLFQHGLPWVMEFDGLNKDAEDGTLVVVGDLGETFEHDRLLYRTVKGMAEVNEKATLRAKLAALSATDPARASIEASLQKPRILSGASLTLDAGDGDYSLFDFYGNPVESHGGKIVVPLDHRGFFLRGNGHAGSFARLKAAVAAAHIDGLSPLETVCHDFTASITEHPTLHLSLRNILNRPVQGTLDVTIGDLKLDYPQTLSLPANELQEVDVHVTDGAAVESNQYPLHLNFDAGADGRSEHDELMRCNVIAKRTITVDGKLDDWVGVLPQPVSSDDSKPTLAEAAWWPMKQFDRSSQAGSGVGFLACDDHNFYFASKVADSTPDAGTLRFATRDDDQFFYPVESYEYDKDRTLLKVDAHDEQLSDKLPPKPDGTANDGSHWANTNKNTAIGIDLNLPGKTLTKVSMYVGYGYLHPNGQTMQVLDGKTGQVLLEQRWDHFWDGAYVQFSGAGSLRVVLRTGGDWYPIKCYALFLDHTETPAGTAASAKDAAMNFDVKAHWQGTLGTLGHYFIGGPQQLPPDVTIAPVNQIEKKTYHWPDGVRQFSYRKWPIIPSPYWGGEGCRYDNVQIAFNALPQDQKDWLSSPPGTPPMFVDYKTSDYEFALNKVAQQYGGGTEIWRLLVPGMPRKHFYPRQPKSKFDGPALNSHLVIVHEPGSGTRIVECAIPWDEIPAVKALLDKNEPVKFSFRLNDSSADTVPELAAGRSVSKRSGYTFHPDWSGGWANEIEFGWQK